MNDLLSRNRNDGIRDHLLLPDGRLLSADETIRMFPQVDRQELQGAGLWYDALMTQPQRILIDILHWASSLGSTALNYVQANDVLIHRDKVIGVAAHDRVEGKRLEYRSQSVVNCAGPWSRQLAASFDRDLPQLFQPSLAFNVLLDREPLSTGALAVQTKSPGSPVYFLVPWQEKVLAGTVHRPWTGSLAQLQPSDAQINDFLHELNLAVPGAEFCQSEIMRVYSGLLPGQTAGSDKLSKRPVVFEHEKQGGPQGLISVCGIKFTTSRLVAERAIQAISSSRSGVAYDKLPRPDRECPALNLVNPDKILEVDDATLRFQLGQIVEQESVVRIDDLLHRRTGWGTDPKLLANLEGRLNNLLGLQPVVLS